MKTIGYRGARDSYTIDSHVFQFGIPESKDILRVNWRIPTDMELAKIERVRLFLRDMTLIENVFLVDRHFAFYFIEDDKVAISNAKDLTYAAPTRNIQDKFRFRAEDVLIVQTNNKVQLFWEDALAEFPIGWLFGSVFRRADGPQSIKFNTELRLERWSELPHYDQSVIGGYQNG